MEMGLHSERADGEAPDPAGATTARVAADVRSAPLRDVIRYVVDKHHRFIRAELPPLAELMRDVCGRERSPRRGAQTLHRFGRLVRLLDGHLDRGERSLFPIILELEDARRAGRAPTPRAFAPLRFPVAFMTEDHGLAERLLADVRARLASADTDAAPEQTTDAVLRLDALAADLARHVAIEEQVLFPRAIALDEG